MDQINTGRIIEHIRFSHQSLSDTLRFIDGKTPGLFALVSSICGIVLLTLSKIDIETYCTTLFSLESLTVVLLLFSIAAAAISIFSSVQVNLSRSKKTLSEVILFPSLTEKTQNGDELSAKLSGLIKNLDDQGIRNEFADQIANLAIIVSRKSQWFNRATIAFALQLLFGAMGLLIFVLN